MAPHIDILDESDSLRKPLVGSAALHAAVFATVLLSTIAGGARRETWGDPNSLGGGSVAINAVSQIPLPARGGVVNPVANDTDSRIPQAPAVRETRVVTVAIASAAEPPASVRDLIRMAPIRASSPAMIIAPI